MFQTEPIVSRFRRVAPGLRVRSDGDEVRITTRATGLRVLYALVLSGVILLIWYLWRENVFRGMDVPGATIFGGMLLVPLAVIGALYAFPGQRLIASRSGGFVASSRS